MTHDLKIVGFVRSISPDLIASCFIFGEHNPETIELDCYLNNRKFKSLQLSPNHCRRLGENSILIEFNIQIPVFAGDTLGRTEFSVRSRNGEIAFSSSIEKPDKNPDLIGIVTDVEGGAVFGYAKNLTVGGAVILSIHNSDGLLTVGCTGAPPRGAPPSPYAIEDGFTIPLPIQWHHHPAHRLVVTFSNSTVELTGSPVYSRLGMKVDNIKVRKTAIF